MGIHGRQLWAEIAPSAPGPRSTNYLRWFSVLLASDGIGAWTTAAGTLPADVVKSERKFPPDPLGGKADLTPRPQLRSYAA